MPESEQIDYLRSIGLEAFGPPAPPRVEARPDVVGPITIAPVGGGAAADDRTARPGTGTITTPPSTRPTTGTSGGGTPPPPIPTESETGSGWIWAVGAALAAAAVAGGWFLVNAL